MYRTIKFALLMLFAAIPFAGAQTKLPPATSRKVDYKQDIQPLLAQKCYSCHGAEVQQAGLRLDLRQNALRGGDYGPVIKIGDSAASKLIRRLVDQQFHVGERPVAGGVMEGRRTALILPENRLPTGGDLPDLSAISGADRGDQRCYFRIYRQARRLSEDICAELCALIDPCAKQPDFIVGERPGRRHLEASVAVHKGAEVNAKKPSRFDAAALGNP